MHKEPAKYSAAIIFAFWILSTIVFGTAKAQDSLTYRINDIRTTLSGNTLSYTVLGTSVPAYTVSERFSPFRAVIDIAGGVFAENVTQAAKTVPANDFATLSLSELKGKEPEPAILRFEFAIAESHNYSVTRNGNNLEIKITPSAGKKAASADVAAPKKALTGFQIATTPNTTTIVIASDAAIKDYTVDKITGSSKRHPRMFIDIPDVDISELVREKHIGTSVEKIRVAPKGNGARIVFDSKSDKLFRYTVAPSPLGLSIVIDESRAKAAKVASGSDATLESLITSSEKQLKKQGKSGKSAAISQNAKVDSAADKFSFSGYNKQRISVDFYKIDIHNVFRLFRQITDLNIIVDEGVSGSLTLALTDVPWDFALDIILNLMDLKKEERFNTIVIYPAKKEFNWPTRAEDNLSFEADTNLIKQESLIVEQAANQPKEIMRAKELMVEAQNLIKRNKYEDAALLYSKASKLWPENTKLLNRLSTLYLVHLGMNSKAVYYANKCLKKDPKNNSAALYAAIGSANMQRIAEASDFFAQSISDSPPMKEALISYAAFSENNGQNEAALKLLDKYNTVYGETVDTMIAKARVLDKLGRKEDARKQYLALLGSGYKLRPDLKKYVTSRIAVQN